MHLPRVWAEIDLDRITHNLEVCRRLLSGRCRVLGVVKADAYGHGAIPIASALERSGVTMLGVGDSQEAIRLRESGIVAPILVLGAVVDGEVPDLIRHGVTPTVHSPDRIETFDRLARKLDVPLTVHLLVDTGMARLGVTPSRALNHLRAIEASSHLRLGGVGTHLAAPGDDLAFTGEQIAEFRAVIEAAAREGIHPPRLHVVSSQALTRYPDAHFDMARIGGYLYGLSSGELPIGVEPVLSLYTQVVYLRDVPEGTPVGYGSTFVTRRKSRIATLPVGYHDGLSHALSNRAEVLVRGRRAPVIGRVTMDYVTVDVTDVPGAAIGDRVTIIGADGGERVTARELAERSLTIPYEIPCQLGNRVQRYFRTTDPNLSARFDASAWRESVRELMARDRVDAVPSELHRFPSRLETLG